MQQEPQINIRSPVSQIWRRVFQMIEPPLKTSILKITLTYHHYKNVSIAHTSMDDDSSAVDIRKEIKAVSDYEN